MIESLLQRNLNGCWTIPNDSLLEPLESRIKTCAEKCDYTYNRIELLKSDRIGIQDFQNDLNKMRGRLTVLNQRVNKFHQIPIEDLDRKALTALLTQIAVAVGELKSLHTNLHLFDDGDRIYVDDLLEILTQEVGEVPRGFYETKTSEIANAFRALPQFKAFCEYLTEFYTDQVVTHPTLALSFSSDDQEITLLISDLLKRAIKNVIFIEDFGPRASRNRGAFHKELKSADFVLIIASSSYGQKTRSPAPSTVKSEAEIITERFLQRQEHVMTLIVEGSLDSSLPAQMAHSSFGHLTARSALELFPALLEVLNRVYYGRNMDATLAELKRKTLARLESSPTPPFVQLKQGASGDATDQLDCQPLHSAARDGQKEQVELLLKQGAKVDLADTIGSQPLHWAALNGHKEIVDLLLIKGGKINATDKNGSQPLHWATAKKRKEVVEFLLSKGAAVNAVDNYLRRPLHLAAIDGDKEIVELLLRMGADANAADKEGNLPLNWAQFYNNGEVVELLLKHGAKVDAADKDWKPLHAAAECGHKEVVELLLKQGAKVDAANKDDWQPIHLAALHGHKEVVELLLKQGAKVDAANNNGWQPVHLATRNGHKEIVEFLLRQRAKADAASKEGWQPLHSAAHGGHKEVVELLLKNGANVDANNNHGVRPLDVAALYGHLEVVELLLKQGAKVNAEKNDGWQPLHAAAMNGHQDVVKLLLKHGAKADAIDKYGYQALTLAFMKSHKAVIEILIENGLNSARMSLKT